MYLNYSLIEIKYTKNKLRKQQAKKKEMFHKIFDL